MLAQGSKPMNCARYSATSMLAPSFRRALTLAVFLFAGLIYAPQLILAQNSFQPSGPITPWVGRGGSFTGATPTATLFNSSAFPAFPGAGPGIRAIGLPQTPYAAVTRDPLFEPFAWNRRPLEPSQPWIGIDRFGGSASGSIGFTGIGRQQGSGFNNFSRGGLGSPEGNLTSLFPATGTFPRAQAFGTVQGMSGMLPRLDTRVAGSVTLPFNSSVGTLRMSYREMFGDGRNAIGTNFATGSGSATFGTSNLGNGMFLSAGTSYNSRSTAGSTVGSAALGGQKHSGPSVGLKLSF